MNYIVTEEEFEHYANALFKIMAEDHLKPRIHETYPLEDVARAHNVGVHPDLLAKEATDDFTRILRVARPWANCS